MCLYINPTVSFHRAADCTRRPMCISCHCHHVPQLDFPGTLYSKLEILSHQSDQLRNKLISKTCDDLLKHSNHGLTSRKEDSVLDTSFDK